MMVNSTDDDTRFEIGNDDTSLNRLADLIRDIKAIPDTARFWKGDFSIRDDDDHICTDGDCDRDQLIFLAAARSLCLSLANKLYAVNSNRQSLEALLPRGVRALEIIALAQYMLANEQLSRANGGFSEYWEAVSTVRGFTTDLLNDFGGAAGK